MCVGANLSLKNIDEKTALDFAQEIDHPEIVEMLAEARDHCVSGNLRDGLMD